MSSGGECMIFENCPGEWFYALGDSWAGSEKSDWRVKANAYGPFTTGEAASAHLLENHRNPGSLWEYDFEAMREKRDQTLERLVAGSADNMNALSRSSRY